MLQSIIGVLFGTNNKVKIQLDRSVYYNGDEITGTVLFEINESFEYNDIVMKLKGTENVDLNVDNSLNSTQTSIENSCYYSMAETILEQKYTLIGKNSPIVSGSLNRGNYLLPFRVALPTNIPSTFHFRSYGLHGRIIYTLEVEVTVPGILKRNLKSESVEVGVRQLSKTPVMPLQIVDELPLQTFWCLPSSAVEVAVAMDKNVYAPGDRISLKFAINSPLNKIKNVQIRLVRHIRVGPLDRCRKDEKILGKVNTGRISGCTERRAIFMIPETGPYSVNGKLIESFYELQFKIRPDWCYSSVLNHKIIVNDSLLPTYESIIIK